MFGIALRAALAAGIMALGILAAGHAYSHDVYGDLHGKDGQWCCNGDADGKTGDCAPALAIINADSIAFLVRGKDWVHIPANRVTFLPVPGEELQSHETPPDGMIWGHFCGRPASEADRTSRPQNVFGGWYFYCGFVLPGGV